MTISSLSLGRFDGNDYSVPTMFAYQSLTAAGTIERVGFSQRGKVVARVTLDANGQVIGTSRLFR